MVFNSLAFLVFLPVVALLHTLVPARVRWLVMLVASLVFYGWWKAEYLVLLGISVMVGWGAGMGMQHSSRQWQRNAWMLAGILLNLGILFYYKYFGFFAGVIGWRVEDILLPVGISFYTFQILSYVVDVWKGTTAVEPNPLRFALFASFFPQLVAGPIERSSHLLPQMRTFGNIRYDDLRAGMERVIIGLVKKVVLADRLAALVNVVYGNPGNFSGPQLVLATVFFGFQIYGDFSGYSDIAIGCARIFGVNIMDNFRQPYLARSVPEFWSRWHISLSTWFRDYVYIPLGGNRRKPPRVMLNLLVTFLLSGLWHGANWTFLAWGGWHGVWSVLDRWVTPRVDALDARVRRLLDLPRLAGTFGVVMAGWVFFRAKSMGDALTVFARLGTGWNPRTLVAGFSDLGLDKFLFLWSVAMIFVLGAVHVLERKESLPALLARLPLLRWIVYPVLVLVLLLMGVSGSESQFIYFQF